MPEAAPGLVAVNWWGVAAAPTQADLYKLHTANVEESPSPLQDRPLAVWGGGASLFPLFRHSR